MKDFNSLTRIIANFFEISCKSCSDFELDDIFQKIVSTLPDVQEQLKIPKIVKTEDSNIDLNPKSENVKTALLTLTDLRETLLKQYEEVIKYIDDKISDLNGSVESNIQLINLILEKGTSLKYEDLEITKFI